LSVRLGWKLHGGRGSLKKLVDEMSDVRLKGRDDRGRGNGKGEPSYTVTRAAGSGGRSEIFTTPENGEKKGKNKRKKGIDEKKRDRSGFR